MASEQIPSPIDLQTAFSIAFRRLDNLKIEISINGRGAWVLLRQLQLAHHCPANVGEGRALAGILGRQIQAEIAPGGALAAVAEEGWDRGEGDGGEGWLDAWPSASPW